MCLKWKGERALGNEARQVVVVEVVVVVVVVVVEARGR